MKDLKKNQILAALLEGLDYAHAGGQSHQRALDCTITTVVCDSRKVVPGALFVAIVGDQADGHDYLEDAVAAGCTAIVCMQGRISSVVAEELDVVVIEVVDSCEAYGAICAAYFSYPGNHLRLLGITGTNGKTTSTFLLEQILLAAGHSVGVIGTVNNRYTVPGGTHTVLPTRFTTPEPFLLQELLFEMVLHDVEFVVMEVSSHALAQARVAGLSFDIAAFTNLSRDHLDYHENMEDYFQAKALLFRRYLAPDGIAVLPYAAEKTYGGRLKTECDNRGVTTFCWGEQEGADLRVLDMELSAQGARVRTRLEGTNIDFTSQLPGRFNVENLMIVVGICHGLGLDQASVVRAVSLAKGAPGRVERVSLSSVTGRDEPLVLVDYAHTPDALEKVLSALVRLPHEKLISVVGCGGDRDKGKRPLMGKAAVKQSDITIITSDNPRTEDPLMIVSDILVGIQKETDAVLRSEEWLQAESYAGGGYLVVIDRARAIKLAVRAAGPGDIVLIAGKGHEPYQILGKDKKFFDDRLEARRALLGWNVFSVCRAVGGSLSRGDQTDDLLGQVVIDSRVKGDKNIFVALRGENHDAHDFVDQAVEHGARCLVVERTLELENDPGVIQIVVDDSLRALGDLAAFRRRQIGEVTGVPLLAITGSCGKTTVKEMTACILAELCKDREFHPVDPLLKTSGNFNNLVGVPLSLLPIDVQHRAVILEMGANHLGELARLGEIAEPDIACITNIHGAHLEGFGSLEGVAAAKAELFDAVGTQGTLVVNMDDPRVRQAARFHPGRKIGFSIERDGIGDADIDLYATKLKAEDQGCWSMQIHYQKETVAVGLGVAGRHNLSNGLAAAALALAVGAQLVHIQAGLESFRASDKRMAIVRSDAGVLVINDTYNANPASMAAGVNTLGEVTKGCRVAMLGDMFELGDAAEKAHFELGQLVGRETIDFLFTVGSFAETVSRGALDAGMKEQNIYVCGSKEEALENLRALVAQEVLGKGDGLLVKASRGMRFETIVQGLLEFDGSGKESPK